MFNLLVGALAGLGKAFASMGSVGCAMLFLDEPECPKSLLK